MDLDRAARVAPIAALLLIGGLLSVALSGQAASAATPDPGSYRTLTPARILDTRVGTGAPTAPVAAGATLDVTALGRGGLPTAGVSAVVFNLTDVAPSTYGFISAFPAGQPVPLASSLNFAAGETRAHLAVIAPGTDGQLALYNGSAGPVDLLVDVVGYYTSGTPVAGGEFAPLIPARVLDTRTGNGAPAAPVRNGYAVVFAVAGRGGVPATGASTVLLNLTATRPTGAGWLAASANGSTSSSSVNFSASNSASNLVAVAIAQDGTVDVSARVPGHVDVVADVVGYFAAGAPSAQGRFGALNPSRLLDTRTTRTPVPAFGTVTVSVAGHNRVPPTGVSAAMLNITVPSPGVSGFVSAYPSGIDRPNASSVNFTRSTVANEILTPLGSDGSVRIYNGASVAVNLVVDVSGYVGPIPGGLDWSGGTAIPIDNLGVWHASCATASFCVAHDGTNVYRWDGHAWSAPFALSDYIGDLSCPVAGFCAAVIDRALDFYDGSSWRSSGLPAGAGQILSVSCASATSCVAMEPQDSGQVRSWIFDGTTWTERDTGLVSTSGPVFVSCASAVFCLAATSSGSIARLDATTWTPTATAALGSLYSLSCVSSTFCVAAGDGDAAVYDGSHWSAPTVLDVSTATSDSIRTVSCSSTTFCLAMTDFGTELVYDAGSWSSAVQVDPVIVDVQNLTCGRPKFCLITADDQSFLGT